MQSIHLPCFVSRMWDLLKFKYYHLIGIWTLEGAFSLIQLLLYAPPLPPELLAPRWHDGGIITLTLLVGVTNMYAKQ